MRPHARCCPPTLITALTCGLAPGLLDPAATGSAEGPRVDGPGIELSSDGKKMIIPVTAALVPGTVPGSVEVTTLTADKGDRWVVEDIYDTAYDPDWGDSPGGAIVVRLAYSLAERPAGALVRVRVCGTGGKPVMGADPLAPLAGLVGGPPATQHEGHDAVWTFRTAPPAGDGDRIRDEQRGGGGLMSSDCGGGSAASSGRRSTGSVSTTEVGVGHHEVGNGRRKRRLGTGRRDRWGRARSFGSTRPTGCFSRPSTSTRCRTTPGR